MTAWILRPAHDNDFDAVLACADAAVPFDPEGNRIWLRRRRAFAEESGIRRHYVVVEKNDERQIVGYGGIEQQGPDAQRLRLYLVTDPERLRDGVGNLLFGRLKRDAQVLKTSVLWTREYKRDQVMLDFLAGNRFKVTETVWDQRRPVADFHLDQVRPRWQPLAEQGIAVMTLAEAQVRDDDYVERLYDLFLSTRPEDAPPITRTQYAHWLEQPDVPTDSYFVARRDGGARYVGNHILAPTEDDPGWLTDIWLRTRPGVDHQTLSLALRAHGLHYARQHGYTTVVTYTDADDAATLATNDTLGFKRAFGYVTQELHL